MKLIKKALPFLWISVLASLSALNYAFFIFPNSFAPSGIDGISTMIQDISGVNIGYFSLLFNFPLLFLAFFHLNRDFAVKSTLYVFVFSITSILLKSTVSPYFGYYTDTGSSVVLAPIAAGIIRGLLYAFTLCLNGSSGGTDIVAAVIKKKKPHLDLMNVIFFINLLIALCSFFVYGMKAEPVICSILYALVTSGVSRYIRANRRRAVKYEIITSDAKVLCGKIAKGLHQTATVVDAKGAYSDTDKKMVVCVVSKQNAPYLEEIILSFSSAVVFKSEVDNGVVGIDYK